MRISKKLTFMIFIPVVLLGCNQEEDMFSEERTIKSTSVMREGSGGTSFQGEATSQSSREKNNYYLNTDISREGNKANVYYKDGREETFRYNPNIENTEKDFDGR